MVSDTLKTNKVAKDMALALTLELNHILAFSSDELGEEDDGLDEEKGDDFGDDDEEEDLEGFEIEGDNELQEETTEE